MKYLGLHKIIWAILVLVWLILEMIFIGLCYVLYVIWNFKIPHNFWLKFYSYESDWDGEQIADRNPWQTFVRIYNFF